ncbi:unnamed protein product [Rhizoctonia solani]|uniref:DUF6535 domain-containing protein n=1 Tax=Rhizoctonia solani TaxID=456999 RepID=A0A8H3CRN8_9AGAM|nr:unnamed protein product [Rhizoctonia solani]
MMSNTRPGSQGLHNPNKMFMNDHTNENADSGTKANVERDSDQEYNEKLRQAQAHWDNRRKAGFEDYGAEMDKDARIWKAYVQETDQADREMVYGWNNFLTTVSANLEPDFGEESTKTLQAILTTLQVASLGPATNFSTPSFDPFIPSHTTVMVNTLWYLSLSLSVAVALLAMLAKEWCHLFMSNRTGQMYEQGRRRQQRWDEIERWKMIDVITLLPVLMHIALFLFAVGLSLRLWDLNVVVAIPVVITTGISTILYTSTYWLPLIFEFCPYSTASSKLMRGYAKSGITALWNQTRPQLARIHRYIVPRRFAKTPLHFLPVPWLRVTKKGPEQNSLACVGTTLAKDPTPMDLVTSRMLSWMTTNCEEPKLVDLVIQALAGAKPWLPRLPLLQCGLQMQLLDRLYGLIDFDFTKHTYFLKGSASSDLALLYFRALFFLHSYNNGEGFYNDLKIESDSFALRNTWEKVFDIRRGGLIVDTLFSSWGYGAKFDLPCDTADPLAYMNVFKLPSCRTGDGSLCAKFDIYDRQVEMKNSITQ